MSTQVTLSASATGSFTETFRLGDHCCSVNGGCQTLGALGVAFIDFTSGIHAAGSVDANRASTFDRAISGLDFTWELITDAGNIAFGGGAASARREANIEAFSDTVGAGSAVVRMRPGDGLELRLRAHGESLANGAGGRAESRVLFSNTLRRVGRARAGPLGPAAGPAGLAGAASRPATVGPRVPLAPLTGTGQWSVRA